MHCRCCPTRRPPTARASSPRRSYCFSRPAAARPRRTLASLRIRSRSAAVRPSWRHWMGRSTAGWGSRC
jgi:hypothetical protein